MGHLRMPGAMVAERAKPSFRSAKTQEPDYFFSLGRFQALQFISQLDVVNEGEYVDPWDIFPPRVMRKVDYGTERGIQCHVCTFISPASGEPVGALMHLYIDENRSIGYYAVRLKS